MRFGQNGIFAHCNSARIFQRNTVRPIAKSNKLDDVCYEIRGPALEKARQMEEDGQKIIKLNIGNLAVFGFDAPDEIVSDMIRNKIGRASCRERVF